jgi:hypothetical protein
VLFAIAAIARVLSAFARFESLFALACLSTHASKQAVLLLRIVITVDTQIKYMCFLNVFK